MKAFIESWKVSQVGPAFHTRQEHSDGSISFDSMNEVQLRLSVVGNEDAMEFMEAIKALANGAKLKSIEIEPSQPNEKGRKYVFFE